MLHSYLIAAELGGILPTRGSIMLDVVFVAMFLIVPLLAYSIYLVKFRRAYVAHKRWQLGLGLVLLVAVAAFEIDMQLFTNWRDLAAPSPYYKAGEWSLVTTSLAIHLCFAIPTTFLWIIVISLALWRFPAVPLPGPHSKLHKRLAWPAAIGMAMTAATGWIFYWLAFVA